MFGIACLLMHTSSLVKVISWDSLVRLCRKDQIANPMKDQIERMRREDLPGAATCKSTNMHILAELFSFPSISLSKLNFIIHSFSTI